MPAFHCIVHPVVAVQLLMCEHSKFLVEIVDLLVLCLCHAFQGHILSPHNSFGHLIFFFFFALSTMEKEMATHSSNLAWRIP